MIIRRLLIALIVLLVGTRLIAAQDTPTETVHTGTLTRRHPSDTYSIDMQNGQSVLLIAIATTGDLDPNLKLADPSGKTVAENDDRNDESLDAALGYTAIEDGTYTVTVSRNDQVRNSGDYKLTIDIGDSSVLAPLSDLTSVGLSGTAKLIDTEHFRIHYTLDGTDATTDDFARQVADTMETVWDVEINQMDWPAPPTDGSNGGDSRLDIYMTDMLDSDGSGALGVTSPGDTSGDNPNTPQHERYATYSTIRLENDFAEAEDDKTTPLALMRATAAHEFHHAVQHGLDAQEPFTWYYEATSTWMETQVFPKNQAAVGYVDYNYEYPELCFGTENDPDGLLMYGDWMFIQSLVDQYGVKVIHDLWNNIAQYDGWDALQHTLADFGDETIPEALARYHVQNLVRDYKFATYFGNAKVFLENDIRDTGRWTYSGDGIEQLGANYYNLHLPGGRYNISLTGDRNRLDLWAIGVHGKQADAFDLGRQGNVSTSGYDHMYLLVFDPVFQQDVNDCSYQDYSIQVGDSSGALTPLDQTWNARYFTPPE